MHDSSDRRPPDLPWIRGRFAIDGQARDVRPVRQGHINDTYLAAFENAGATERYIIQRVNARVFRDVPALMHNLARVCEHVAARSRQAGDARRALTLIPGRDGAPFCRDAAGEHWRVFRFIDRTVSREQAESPGQAYQAAYAFGRFQRELSDLPGPRLHETIPNFHHTPLRLAALLESARRDRAGRALEAKRELEFAAARAPLAGVLRDLLRRGAAVERIAHNDAKINNVLFDERSGEAVCVIDLDTVMPGLSLYDFGDLVRSGATTAAEDDPDPSRVALRLDRFEALVNGYVRGAGGLLGDAERAHLAMAGQVITFEQGLRFLADHLDGDVYYKTGRAGQNLDRARNQFALLRSMEVQAAAMEAIQAAALRDARG